MWNVQPQADLLCTDPKGSASRAGRGGCDQKHRLIRPNFQTMTIEMAMQCNLASHNRYGAERHTLEASVLTVQGLGTCSPKSQGLCQGKSETSACCLMSRLQVPEGNVLALRGVLPRTPQHVQCAVLVSGTRAAFTLRSLLGSQLYLVMLIIDACVKRNPV